jgi:glycolate oxidase FAD binding subunit
MTVFRPSDAAEVEKIVAWAVAGTQSLAIVGGGSKRALGRPTRTDHTLDLGALRGIVDYDPAELVLIARTATPMAEIEGQLKAHRQMLAFEPPDWRGLLSNGRPASDREPTLGGVVACNMAGPRRVRAGAARDHFLGFAAVNGWGDGWKAGGRVVKNVTGYDMCKLQAGAYGTLSVLTEIAVKVVPQPESSCSLLLPGLADAAAIQMLAAALNSSHEVSAAAHLPAPLAARSRVTAVAGAGGAVTAVRLEGPRPSVEYRAGALAGLLGRAMRLRAAESEALWVEIGAVQPLLGPGDTVVWRICPTPAASPALVCRIQAGLGSAEAFYDWAGGLLWLSLDADDAGPDCGAALVRAAVAEVGGHATLIRASDPAREVVPVFEPAQAALEALARRVKLSFDPMGILNPGRMQADI